MPRSIIGWFIACWGAFLFAAVIVGILLFSLYSQSTTEQLQRASAAIDHGCDAIANRYQVFVARRAPSDLRGRELVQGLIGVIRIALRDLPGVEGGIWQADRGSLAYAFPTYEGTGEKTELSPAEEPQIREVATAAALDGVTINRRTDDGSQAVLLHACPLRGPLQRVSAWTMTHGVITGGRAYRQAMAGFAILLLVVLGSAAWLGPLLLGRSRLLRRLELALASSTDELPKLGVTGQRDLDRIVDAVNRAGTRLSDARREAEALMRQVAEGRRLATLRRVVAGVADEIQNPIAAMRLKAENAVAAGPDLARKDRALQTIVEQMGRLEAFLRNLLSSVRRAELTPKLVEDVTAFLEKRAELFHEQAAAHGLALKVIGCDGGAMFDPARIAQAIDNLMVNAIENTPRGGSVTLCAERMSDWLVLSVVDTGHGIPESMRDSLFEPFASGRPEDAGLGLAVVREIAEAHGGTAGAFHRNDGTTFVIELPWRLS